MDPRLEEDDEQLKFVLELSRREAEEEEKKRKGFGYVLKETKQEEGTVSQLHQINCNTTTVGHHLCKVQWPNRNVSYVQEFTKLYNTTEFRYSRKQLCLFHSDIVLVLGDERIQAHKIVSPPILNLSLRFFVLGLRLSK